MPPSDWSHLLYPLLIGGNWRQMRKVLLHDEQALQNHEIDKNEKLLLLQFYNQDNID